MNKGKAMFIKTKDKETSDLLKTEGFHLVDYTSGVWTFLYDENRLMTFDDNKIVYSNMLCF